MEHLTLRVILTAPPLGVDFGVQSGRGAGYDTMQRKRSSGGDLRFEFTVAIKGSATKAPPDFGGVVVQGRAGERFVYIDIGTYAGQTDTPWSRRLKIPLSGITWDAIARALANTGAVLEARVAGTGRDGGPNCATPKPFDGWKLTK